MEDINAKILDVTRTTYTACRLTLALISGGLICENRSKIKLTQ
jgi:hypothetical protein